jgi:hypothetical protein
MSIGDGFMSNVLEKNTWFLVDSDYEKNRIMAIQYEW